MTRGMLVAVAILLLIASQSFAQPADEPVEGLRDPGGQAHTARRKMLRNALAQQGVQDTGGAKHSEPPARAPALTDQAGNDSGDVKHTPKKKPAKKPNEPSSKAGQADTKTSDGAAAKSAGAADKSGSPAGTNDSGDVKHTPKKKPASKPGEATAKSGEASAKSE